MREASVWLPLFYPPKQTARQTKRDSQIYWNPFKMMLRTTQKDPSSPSHPIGVGMGMGSKPVACIEEAKAQHGAALHRAGHLEREMTPVPDPWRSEVRGHSSLSHNQHPVLKWSTQNHASRIKKAAAAIYGWDCPLLTFIYLGLDCGSVAPQGPSSHRSPFWEITIQPMASLKRESE